MGSDIRGGGSEITSFRIKTFVLGTTDQGAQFLWDQIGK